MKLICMGFDGEFQTERPVFDTIEDAWEYSNDLGSKWYFYPFHFVVTDSLLTVKSAPEPRTEEFAGKRVSTIVKMMQGHSADPDMEDAGVDEFWMTLPEE